jgi:hypothetical protein
LRKKGENIAELQCNFGVMKQNYADVNRRIRDMKFICRNKQKRYTLKAPHKVGSGNKFSFKNYTFLVLEHLSNANESLRKKEEELSALQRSFEVTEQNYADANKRIVGMKSKLSC